MDTLGALRQRPQYTRGGIEAASSPRLAGLCWTSRIVDGEALGGGRQRPSVVREKLEMETFSVGRELEDVEEMMAKGVEVRDARFVTTPQLNTAVSRSNGEYYMSGMVSSFLVLQQNGFGAPEPQISSPSESSSPTSAKTSQSQLRSSRFVSPLIKSDHLPPLAFASCSQAGMMPSCQGKGVLVSLVSRST